MISREQAIRIQSPQSNYKYFRQDELALIFSEMERRVISNVRREKYTRRYRLLINVLYYTGARIDEVLPARDRPYKRMIKKGKKKGRKATIGALNTSGLRPRDFDFDSDVVHMINLKQRGGKDNKTVPLTPQLKEAVQSYLLWFGISSKSEEPLFPQRRQTVENYLNDMGDLLNMKIHPHKFRHTFGHTAARSGVFPATLKKWMGHRSISNTMIYYEISGEETRAEMSKMRFINWADQVA